MTYNILYDKLPFLKLADKQTQRQFEEYFSDVPLWLLESFQIEELKKGSVMIKEGTEANTIYFVGKGIIEAVDYRVCGLPYNYMQFSILAAFGGMEVIMDLDRYKTTLRALTDCTVVKLSRSQFEKWLRSDIRALKREARRVAEYLSEDARLNRLYLFMQGSDRLALMLVKRYEQFQKNGVMRVFGNRQSLADETGLCVKSISRSIKKFQDEGLISKDGHQIVIDEEQYRKLKEIMSLKIDLNEEV